VRSWFRAPTPEEPPPPPAPVKLARAAAPVPAPAAAQPRAVEPEPVHIVREEPPRKNHTFLWILTGVIVAGAAVGGYYAWHDNQTATTANIDLKWPH